MVPRVKLAYDRVRCLDFPCNLHILNSCTDNSEYTTSSTQNGETLPLSEATNVWAVCQMTPLRIRKTERGMARMIDCLWQRKVKY
jgi:hypothetical protein